MSKEDLKAALERMLWKIEAVGRLVPVLNGHIIGGRYLYLLRLMIRERWEVWVYPPEEDAMTLGEILQIVQEKLVD